jgi:hypothetical protein
MGAKLIVEAQRSEPNDYGKIKIRLDLKKAAWSAEKVRALESRVEDCLDALQEEATGSKPTVAGAEAGTDRPVKGQRKLPLNKDGTVKTKNDSKTPAEAQAELDKEDDQLRDGQAAEDPAANPNRPVARPAPEFAPV